MKKIQLSYSIWDIRHMVILIIKSKLKKIPKVIDDISTSDMISHGKNSVCRFGDGEIDLIYGKDLKFQKYNKEISTRLKEILYSNDDNIMICIPNVFSYKGLKPLTKESRSFWIYHVLDRYEMWEKYLNKKKIYYDASVSRPYIRNRDKRKAEIIFSNLKRLWDNNDILIVEGKKSRLGVGNDLFDNVRSIQRILCPAKNAYQVYDEILAQTNKYSEGKLIIIALGPTATVLAYDLAKYGKLAVDLGHIDLEYEWYLKNTSGRVEINGKAINELDCDGDVDIYDAKYNSEILMEIK